MRPGVLHICTHHASMTAECWNRSLPPLPFQGKACGGGGGFFAPGVFFWLGGGVFGGKKGGFFAGALGLFNKNYKMFAGEGEKVLEKKKNRKKGIWKG